jgi:hypothetical protein
MPRAAPAMTSIKSNKHGLPQSQASKLMDAVLGEVPPVFDLNSTLSR